jgi:hypothetical protein
VVFKKKLGFLVENCQKISKKHSMLLLFSSNKIANNIQRLHYKIGGNFFKEKKKDKWLILKKLKIIF